MHHARLAGGLSLALLACLAACETGPISVAGEGPAAPDATMRSSRPTTGPAGVLGDPPPPFESLAPEAYVARVKDLLVGQAPTDAELAAVRRDPAALGDLVDRWMGTPEYQARMLVFFRGAFQQGPIGPSDLVDQLPVGVRANPAIAARLMRDLQDSFARTVLQLIAEGRPFHEAITTTRFVVNPPLLALMAYIDNVHIDDRGARHDRLLQGRPGLAVTLHGGGPAIPVADSIDPASPRFMHWSNPIKVPPSAPPGCRVEPRAFSGSTSVLLDFLFGWLDGDERCPASFTGPGQFTDDDFDAWRVVTLRPPRPGEAPTRFYDLPALRGASEVVLAVPRVGFFSTPAFFATWPTSASNQARVTMNQALIVALGASFDDGGSITPVSEVGLDQGHAVPGSPCYGCHRTLDPMRQYFRQAYTLSYHEQTDPAQVGTPGTFAVGGVTSRGSGIADLADKLAHHPSFAAAWTQKVCVWASAGPCAPDDPELLRVAAAFEASGFDWRALLRELLSSPLVTGAAATRTSEVRGLIVNVARQGGLCASLSTRLAVSDVCGLEGGAGVGGVKELASGVPGEGYSRGSVAPVLANDPSLFHRGATENLCRSLAAVVVDGEGPSARYSSRQPEAAIADLVHNLMALAPSDARSAPVQQILADHHRSALGAGLAPPDALRSTFVLACESPTSVARGL